MGAKSRAGSWDILTTPFPGSLLRPSQFGGNRVYRLGDWGASTPSAVMGLWKQEGVLVSGTATSLSSSELHDCRLTAVTAPGALWSPNPTGEQRRKERWDLVGEEPQLPPGLPKAPSLPLYSSVFQLHEYLLSTYYVLRARGYTDKHAWILGLRDLRLINRSLHPMWSGGREASVQKALGPLAMGLN